MKLVSGDIRWRSEFQNKQALTAEIIDTWNKFDQVSPTA